MMTRPRQPFQVLDLHDVIRPSIGRTPLEHRAHMPRAVRRQIDLEDVIRSPLKDPLAGMEPADLLLLIPPEPRRSRLRWPRPARSWRPLPIRIRRPRTWRTTRTIRHDNPHEYPDHCHWAILRFQIVTDFTVEQCRTTLRRGGTTAPTHTLPVMPPCFRASERSSSVWNISAAALTTMSGNSKARRPIRPASL